MLVNTLNCFNRYAVFVARRCSLMWLTLSIALMFGISMVYVAKEKFEKEKADKENWDKFQKQVQILDKEAKKANISFSEMMITNMKKQYLPHYRFYNVDDPIYRTVQEVPHTCGADKRPVVYSPRFKSYCWFENDCGCNTEPSLIRCLPKFHLIGFPKSGTTDLFLRIQKHPDVIAAKKESNYWSVGRYREYNRTIAKLKLDRATITEADIQQIQDTVKIKPNITRYLNFFLKDMPEFEQKFMESGNKSSNMIIGEGSVTYVYGSMGLRMSVGSVLEKPMMEVDCHVGKIIRWLTPDAKIVISVRDPVDRLFSDYRNLFTGLKGSDKSPTDFHKRVVTRISEWQRCVAQHSEDYCATSPMFEAIATHNHLIGLARSMYAIHIKKWLEVFPREQILVIQFENRNKRPTQVLEEIMDFLELDPLPRNEMDKIAQSPLSNYESLRYHQAGRLKEPMLEKTRIILQDFYRPFNLDLVKLLQDNMYLWYDNEEKR